MPPAAVWRWCKVKGHSVTINFYTAQENRDLISTLHPVFTFFKCVCHQRIFSMVKIVEKCIKLKCFFFCVEKATMFVS